MNEDLLSELWSNDNEEKPTPDATKKGKKKKSTPITTKPETDISGFSCDLEPIKRKGKPLPIHLAKDTCCWILKVGSHTMYPTSVTGLFMTLASEEITLSGNVTTDEVLAEIRRVRDEIFARVANLEKKVETWATDAHRQCEL